MGTSSVVKSESPVSKHRLGIAGVAAFMACAACCAIPMLAAAGFGSGLIAALFRPGSELLVGVTVFLAAIGVMAARSRLKTRSAQGCGSACRVDGSCCDQRTVARNA